MTTKPLEVMVLTPYLYDQAPGQRYRVEQWARHLAAEDIRFHFFPFESDRLKRIIHQRGKTPQKIAEVLGLMVRRLGHLAAARGRSVVYVYRELLPIGPAILERVLGMMKVPFVYDFDDAIFLPTATEVNSRFQWLKAPSKVGTICRLSDHVIVGNDYLARYAKKYSEKVTVIQTTIDTRRYQRKKNVDINGTPVIGWTGSFTTIAHLKTAETMIGELAAEIPFKLKVIGSPEDAYQMPGVETEYRTWSAESEVEELRSFDVGIMPLPEDEWSKGKCGLKGLQYMALGIPTVMSPTGVNSEIIRDGENGFLASSKKEWKEKLTRLLTDAELRRRFSLEGRRTVEETYSAEVQAPRFLELLRSVAES